MDNQDFNLAPDFIGSTITRVYRNSTNHPQRYSNYDDGGILVIEYKTKSGQLKRFSFGNGNIDADSDDESIPIRDGFLFDEVDTNILLHYCVPWREYRHCPDCEVAFNQDVTCEFCERCYECEDFIRARKRPPYEDTDSTESKKD